MAVVCLGEGHAEKGVVIIMTHCRYMIVCERIANIGIVTELLGDIVWLTWPAVRRLLYLGALDHA